MTEYLLIDCEQTQRGHSLLTIVPREIDGTSLSNSRRRPAESVSG